MATYTKTYTSVYGGLTLEAVCTYTDNVASNNSTVSVTLNLKHGEFYASALSGSYLSVAGVKSTYTKSISWSGGSTTTPLATKTVTVAHNSEGAGSCRIIGTFVLNGSYGSTSIGTMTIDQTLTLTKIPRASTVSVPTTASTGSTLTATITPANSSFKHKVQYKIGATTFFTSEYLPATTTTYAKEIPHSWLATSASSTLVVLLTTYTSDGTQVGTDYKLVSLSVPSTIVPTISAFTATSSVTAGTFAGLHVQGKTAVNLSVTAVEGSGSTSIKSYTYSGPNVSTEPIASNTFTTPTLQMAITQAPQTVRYTVQVKDSRDRPATKTVDISVWPYSKPSISSVSVQRCDANGNISENGTYAKYTINSSYSSVNAKNTRTITAAYSTDGGVTYSAETTVQAATETANTKTGVYGTGNFATTSAYTIRFTIKDAYGATDDQPTIASLQSAKRPINIRPTGKGVAIGAMSTKDAFEVVMPADIQSTLDVSGATTLDTTLKVGGATTMTGALTVGGTITSNGSFTTSKPVTMSGTNTLSGGTTVSGAMSMTNSVSMTNYPTIAGTQMADFVTSYGSSSPSTGGNWTWRKWKSGRVEATFERALGSLALTTKAVDGVYTGTNSSGTIVYPTNLFTNPPLIFPSLHSSGYTTMICPSVTKADCTYRIWSPYSTTTTCSFVLYLVGWNI